MTLFSRQTGQGWPREPVWCATMNRAVRMVGPTVLPFIARIAAAYLRAGSVLIHKPSILEPEKFCEKYVLYRYASRYLLERVSWLCRDARRDPRESARVVFSNRASMSYDTLRSYLATLQAQTDIFDVRIDWSVIRPNQIGADQHGRLMGLQIADAVASGMWYGVEKSRHGFIEPRYAEMLRPTIYGRRGRRLGYGLKLWPRELTALLGEFPELEWIRRLG